jgi:hypothetical protein
MQRANSAADLSGTVYAVDGAVFLFESLILVQLGFILPILGVLLYTGKKGSYFWLLGFLPVIVLNVGITWEPSQYIPPLFGIGGVVILLSYLGILWFWTRTYTAYEGSARTGRHIQLLGYSFLVVTGILLCSHIGNPNVLALADLPTASAESINVASSLSMLLLFLGHYVVARSLQEVTASQQEVPASQQEAIVSP